MARRGRGRRRNRGTRRRRRIGPAVKLMPAPRKFVGVNVSPGLGRRRRVTRRRRRR